MNDCADYVQIVPCIESHPCGCRPVGTPSPPFVVTTTQMGPPPVCTGSGYPLVTGASMNATTTWPCGVCGQRLDPTVHGLAPTHAYRTKEIA